MKSSMKRVHLEKGTRDSLLDVFKMNDNLHQAFFKYNGKDVENAAKSLNDAISRVSDKDVGQLLKFSRSKLSEIKASKNRAENNQSYHLVSMALIHILKNMMLVMILMLSLAQWSKRNGFKIRKEKQK